MARRRDLLRDVSRSRHRWRMASGRAQTQPARPGLSRLYGRDVIFPGLRVVQPPAAMEVERHTMDGDWGRSDPDDHRRSRAPMAVRRPSDRIALMGRFPDEFRVAVLLTVSGRRRTTCVARISSCYETSSRR